MNQPTIEFPALRALTGGDSPQNFWRGIADSYWNFPKNLLSQRTSDFSVFGGSQAARYVQGANIGLLVTHPRQDHLSRGLPFHAALNSVNVRQYSGGELAQLIAGPLCELIVGRAGSAKSELLMLGMTARFQGVAVGAEWLQPGSQPIIERFSRKREYVGRVRDIHRDEGTFTAVLGQRRGDQEDQVVADFDLELLNSTQGEQLFTGAIFTLVTGYRKTVSQSGRVLRNQLDTRVFFQEPRPASPRRREEARRYADWLYDEE